MSALPYSEFEKYLFHRETGGETEWFLQDDCPALPFTNEEIVRFSSEAFRCVYRLPERYSDEQICKGLEYLVNPSAGDACYAFFDENVATAQCCQAIQDMSYIFSLFFEKKCERRPFNSSSGGISTANYLCYMWWDIFPLHGTRRGAAIEPLNRSVLKTLEHILHSDNVACVESALHGLGHWCPSYSMEVEAIIQQNLNKLPAELHAYARAALTGDVQ